MCVCVCVCVCVCACVCSGLTHPAPEDLPNPGIKSASLTPVSCIDRLVKNFLPVQETRV